MTRLSYRLRPVPWLAIVPACAIWAGLSAWAGPALGPLAAAYSVNSCAAVFGLAGAFAVSAEVDPPIAVLQIAPVAYRRTAAVRLAAWLPVALAGLALVSLHVTDRQGLPALPAFGSSAAVFLLATAMSLLLATLAGSYLGGGASLAVLSLLALLGRSWHADPLQLLAAPASQLRPPDVVTVLLAGALANLAFGRLASRQPGWRNAP